MLCRNAEKYPEAGRQWEVPGGRINPGFSLLENLRREVLEETGLEIKYEPTLITAQDIVKKNKHIVRLTYSGFADGEVKLSDEHTEHRWLTLDEVKALEPMDKYFKEVFLKYISQ